MTPDPQPHADDEKPADDAPRDPGEPSEAEKEAERLGDFA